MSDLIPTWWEFVLLALAVFRVWKLLAEDTLLDRPRAWLLGVPGWKPAGHETPPPGYRADLALWLTCPWCAGWWLALTLWLGWLALPEVVLVGATPWALSGLVGLVATQFE